MENILDLLKKHEGTGQIKNGRLMPYKDSVGVLTIGYGRNLDANGIRPSEANLMLENDVKEVISQCEQSWSWFTDLNLPRRAVIISMVFNLGLTGFKGFKRTISHIEVGDFEGGSRELLDSRWAIQVGTRSDELATMLHTGEWL